MLSAYAAQEERHEWKGEGVLEDRSGQVREGPLLVKVPLGLSRRVAGRPHSAANPLSITSTMSQSMIVCNLQTCKCVNINYIYVHIHMYIHTCGHQYPDVVFSCSMYKQC